MLFHPCILAVLSGLTTRLDSLGYELKFLLSRNRTLTVIKWGYEG